MYVTKMADWKKEADFNYMTVSIDESRAEGLVSVAMRNHRDGIFRIT